VSSELREYLAERGMGHTGDVPECAELRV